MASLVTEVLTSTGNLAKDDLSEKINKLMKHVDEVKNQVQDTLDSRYITFFPWLSETIELSSGICAATNEIDTLRKRLETQIKCELQISTSEIQGLSTNLIDVSISLQVVEKMVQIHQLLEKINSDLSNKEYLLAADSLEKIRRMLRDKVNPCEKQVKIFNALKTEYVIRREKLIYDLGDIWKQNIVWNLSKTNDDVQLKIRCPNRHEMESLIRAMQMLNYLDTKLKSFSSHLMSLCKILMNHSVKIETIDCFDVKVSDESYRVSPIEVFENLKRIFRFCRIPPSI
uniref:Centromere/kinetochore protein zw10 N-terminal domain-containing protein n=1 Tax=Strigamia maritima TaxID=126957 RepID=T1JGN1_STRMM